MGEVSHVEKITDGASITPYIERFTAQHTVTKYRDWSLRRERILSGPVEICSAYADVRQTMQMSIKVQVFFNGELGNAASGESGRFDFCSDAGW